jgi:sugar lactone lactonase YvrE
MIRTRLLAPFFVVALTCTATRSHADLVYASLADDNLIVTYDSTATNPTPTIFASTGLSSPRGLAFDAAGNLYVANVVSGTIEKFTPGGVGTVFASGLTNPNGLAFDKAGNLYVANNGSSDNASILKYTPGGVGSVFAPPGLMSAPVGLAFDSAGNLYVANAGGHSMSPPLLTIDKFTPAGVGSVFATLASTQTSRPYGLAIDAADNLYVTHDFGNSIDKFTPAGVGSVFATTGLNGPTFEAFDAAGNLFVANANAGPGNNTIERFTPSGIGSVFTTNLMNTGAYGLAFGPSPTNTSVFGQSVSFTATVAANTPGAGTPTGTVQFQIDGTNFGTAVTLVGGSATSGADSSLSVGAHAIKALYSGDSNFTTSNNTITQTVFQDSTTTTLASTSNPSVYGQSVTFTATLAMKSTVWP